MEKEFKPLKIKAVLGGCKHKSCQQPVTQEIFLDKKKVNETNNEKK